MAKLIKKVLYVGAFAYILGNFNRLAAILFNSFAGLGLTASGSALTRGQLLQPGRLAQVGIEAGRPIMEQISGMTGFPEVFAHLDTIAVLFLAWLVLIVAFFVLAVQQASHAATTAIHALRSGDHGGSGASPSLHDNSNS